jgi:hypothetical protein
MKRMNRLWTAMFGIAGIVMLSASASAAMPRKFTVACDAGRFGHGRTEAAARSNLETREERGPQYRDTYAFDLDERMTQIAWAEGKRRVSRAMTGLTADSIEIYNYHLLAMASVRTFDFKTMLNTSVTRFTSTDPNYNWAVSIQHCAIAP